MVVWKAPEDMSCPLAAGDLDFCELRRGEWKVTPLVFTFSPFRGEAAARGENLCLDPVLGHFRVVALRSSLGSII